jgi:hypothetical protein
MALTSSLALTVRATLTGTHDLGTPSAPHILSLEDSLATGTGADQADQVWGDERSLNATTGEDLDLAGSLTNALGTTVTFARIKGIIIHVTTTTAGYTLQVGGASSNQFINWVANSSDIVNVRGGGVFMLWAPDATAYVVTAGTGDLLKIYNPNAGAITYKIMLIGATA